jgi:SAM-dependent MidA family methyltransferase
VTLRQYIEQEIRERGPMPFSRFMELCLYGVPGAEDEALRGYYGRAREQFGKAGDFYTASDVHAVFGRLLARQFEEMWRLLGSPARLDLVELGPGRGLFAQDVLDWAGKRFPEFSRALECTLVESSAALQRRLQERFSAQISAGRIRVCETIERGAPHADFIVFANEFFDALPVEIVAHQGEMRVAAENGRFGETFVPPSPPALEFLDRYGVHPEPHERVEAPLVAQECMARLAAALPPDRSGFLVFVDYGYTREEQLAGRHRGTVTAFRQHTVSPSPYQAPGEQDITAHVNFTALAAAAEAAGLQAFPLLTQAQFLMGIGEASQFADAFADCRLPQEHAKVALQLKHLVTPAGMGETFHVLVLAKGMEREAVLRLGGMRFARQIQKPEASETSQGQF